MKNNRKVSQRRKKHNARYGITNNTTLKNLTNSLKYLHSQYGDDATDKDRVLGKWVEKRAADLRKTSDSGDSFLFINASVAVAELERLYDTMEMTLKMDFPTVNINGFFHSIRMYVGKTVGGDYTYLTDWKTLIFTIAGHLPETGSFPTMGLDYNLMSISAGLLSIVTSHGDTIAVIPVIPGIERSIKDIYPQNGEPLVNGNLEFAWEKWYELNKLIDNEQVWFKSMRYYDEVLEYTISNDLFNSKKINVA